MKSGKFGFSVILQSELEKIVSEAQSKKDLLKTLVEGYTSFYRIVLIMNCMIVASFSFDVYFQNDW